VSPIFDGVWLLSGLWLLVVYVAVGQFSVGVRFFAVIFGIQAALSLVHSWSTTYTVVFSPLFRAARAERPIELIGVPAIVMVACVGLGVYVGVGPSFEDGEGFGWAHWGYATYMLLFIQGHFWHFAQQDFGVLSLYRQRAKQARPIDRRVDLWYCRGMTLVIQPIIYVYVLAEQPAAQLFLSAIPIPAAWIAGAAHGAIGLAVLASACMVIFELSKSNDSVPKVLYLLIIALHPVALYFTQGLLYYLVYLLTHWTVAIALSWRINRNANLMAEDPQLAWIRYVVGFGGFVAMSLVISVILADFELFANTGFREHVGRSSVWMGLIVGYVLGEQMVHYYCDRCLFRFKDPYVRAHVGPLLK